MKTKIEIFNSVCISTLLYGLESVVLSETRMKSLDSFYFQCLKIILSLKNDKEKGYWIRTETVKEVLQNHALEYLQPSLRLRLRRVNNYFHYQRNHRNDTRDIFSYKIRETYAFKKKYPISDGPKKYDKKLRLITS
jgi:hypothetical protein